MNLGHLGLASKKFSNFSFVDSYEIPSLKKLDYKKPLKSSASNDYFYDQFSIRFVNIMDNFLQCRIDWLKSVVKVFETYIYSKERTDYFSLAERDFDIMIFGGNDVVRAVQFVRYGKAILNRRLKILLMTNSTPSRRAQALNAGFDDVFDTNRTKPAEAVARITAMWARYDGQIHKEEVARVGRARIEAVAEFEALSARECKILEILLGKQGGFASYALLQSELGTPLESITFAHLKVIICDLRKKLRPNYKITARALLGYELQTSKSQSMPFGNKK